MILPTSRFYGLLMGLGAIATTLATALPQSMSPLFVLQWMLIADGVCLGLTVIDGLLARRSRVTVSRSPLERLSIGRDNTVTLLVQGLVQGKEAAAAPPSGQSALPPSELQLYDAYPADMPGTEMPIRLISAGTGEEKITYTVTPQRRGEVVWGDIYVRQRGPLGLAWHRWTIPQTQTVAVYPDLLGLRSLSVRLALQSAGTIRQAQRLNTGTEFAELRDYSTGDDPRLIDWKATARRGQPLVRVLEPEREQTLIVLLDRGRLMTAQVEGLNRFDWGLNATLALALAGIHRGDRVGVGVFDSNIHTWLPPARGQQHLSHMIERLTPIQPILQESDYLNAVSTVVTQQNRRALVVVLTDIVDATASMELLSALSRLRPRYLPLCVTLGDPYIQQQAEALSHTVQDAYTRAVALDLQEQRQVAFAQLRQKGVMVLDAPVTRLSEALVDQYLRIKAKNQL